MNIVRTLVYFFKYRGYLGTEYCKNKPDYEREAKTLSPTTESVYLFLRIDK